MKSPESLSRLHRTVVIGGTGFIGMNLTGALLASGHELLVISRGLTRRPDRAAQFAVADILDQNRLGDLLRDFEPTAIVHLAAATGFLLKEDAEAFRTNTEGTRNVLRATANTPSVRRCIFASSHTVVSPRVANRIQSEGRPPLLYDESKLEAERIVQADRSLSCTWCIVRPCLTWGPWFGRPYRDFFLAIARRRYLHPGQADAPKRLSFVGNCCYQIVQLLSTAAERIHRRTFFLADYETTTLRDWATLIAERMGVRAPRSLAESLVRIGAKAGDVLKGIGYSHPPLTSFRLANIRSDTSRVPIQELESISGPLPYSFEAGIDMTIEWLKRSGLLK